MGTNLSSKLRDMGEGKYAHWCPGCKERHLFHTHNNHPNGQMWFFNGNAEKPSFYASMNVRAPTGRTKCHYFLEEGQLRYLNDSNHALAGQTVDLPDLP